MTRETKVELIRATAPPPTGARWELSSHDRANLILVLRGTWVFEEPLDVARLKEGLSELLCRYPHLAGRMSGGGKAVELCDEGVPFEVASRPEATIDQLTQEAPSIDPFTLRLDKGRVKRGRVAPMAIRATELRDGWVLVVSCTHACLDGDAFYSMVRNWSCLCSGRPVPTPLLDQSRLPRADGRSKAEVKRSAERAGWKKVSAGQAARLLAAFARGGLMERAGAVRFSADALEGLKALAAESSGLDWISTNVALSAHLTRQCARLHGLASDAPCTLVNLVDGRERMSAFPPEFVGNASLPAVAHGIEAGASLGQVAARAHDALSPYLRKPSESYARDFALAVEVGFHRVLMLPYDVAAMHARRPTVTYVNNFSKLPIYDVDFGVEGRPVRPVRVIPHNLPDPVLIWPAPPDEGGLEVYFTGVAAKAARRLPADDPWWRELRLE